MSGRLAQRFQVYQGETGHFYFNRTQSDNRFALCKASLLYEKGVILRFKKIYASTRDIELCSLIDFDSVDQLKERYDRLEELGYGGEFEKYDKMVAPEGALFPFLRVRGRVKYEFIDSGCIWIGSKFEHPRIFVDNSVAHFFSAYSPGGTVRTEPFLPYVKIVQMMPQLLNRNRYADLEINGLI